MRGSTAKKLRKKAGEMATEKSILRMSVDGKEFHTGAAFYPIGSIQRIYRNLKKEHYAGI